MTSDADFAAARGAAAPAIVAWDEIALAPELRQAVERAAALQGIDPVTWLARAISRAANRLPTGGDAAAAASPAGDAQIVRSLTRLLAAVRAREGGAEAAEPVAETPRQNPVRPEPPPLVQLTAEPARAERDPAAGTGRRRPRRRLGTFVPIAAVLLAMLGGIAAFHLLARKPAGPERSLSMALPQAQPSADAARAAATPGPAPPASSSAVSSPAPAPPAVPPAGPAPAAAAPSPQSPPPTSPGAALAPETAGTAADTGSAILSPVDALAAFRLGVRYAFGDGIAQDYQKAAAEFRIAAQQGLPDAQYNLAALYDSGLGVPRDPVRAVIWYHSAAAQGHPSAELNLGLAYANGTGVAQDYAEAVRWFRRAADQGLVTAQYNLAALYASGKGVALSMADAYAWFSIAAGSGDAQAQQQMLRVGLTLTPRQLRDAKALAAALAQEIGHAGEAQPHSLATPPAPSPPTGAAPAPPPANITAAPTAVVAEIQRYLIRLHYDPGRSDGEMGDKTGAAIRKYQGERGIAVDGEPTRALLFRLKAEVQRQQAKQ